MLSPQIKFLLQWAQRILSPTFHGWALLITVIQLQFLCVLHERSYWKSGHGSTGGFRKHLEKYKASHQLHSWIQLRWLHWASAQLDKNPFHMTLFWYHNNACWILDGAHGLIFHLLLGFWFQNVSKSTNCKDVSSCLRAKVSSWAWWKERRQTGEKERKKWRDIKWKRGREGGRKEEQNEGREEERKGGRRGKIIRQNKIVLPYLNRFYYLGVW